jgi:hypothetical protein
MGPKTGKNRALANVATEYSSPNPPAPNPKAAVNEGTKTATAKDCPGLE